MWYRKLIPVCLMISAWVFMVRADDPPKKDTDIKNDAEIVQERLALRFKEFEQKLLRLAQRLEASSKPEDREKAATITKALKLAGQEGTDLKFDKLVSLLRESKTLDLDSVTSIMQKNQDLSKDIRAIIQILLTDNRDAELKAEIARIQDLIKKLNEIIREQQLVRARTERASQPQDQLAKSQAKVKESTKNLSKDIAKANGEKGEPKDGKGEPKDGKSGDGKSGKSGDKKDGSGDKKDGKNGEQNDDANQKTPGRKQVEEAIENMKKAIEELEKKKNDKASGEQDEAIKKLKEAQKKLEELLAQLREEEQRRLLAQLQARCERMLQMQIEVRDGTVTLFKTIEASDDKKASRAEVQRSLQLSDRELEIARMAAQARTLLEAEGSAVAFPEVFRQIQTDMEDVAKRLHVTDVGNVTQTIEQDIIDTLKDMIEALKKQQKDNKDKAGKAGNGKENDGSLINLIAELKMIRSLQIRVNNRTRTYSQEYPTLEQTPGPEVAKTPADREKADRVRDEFKELSKRQQQIFKKVNDLARGKNEGGRS